MEDWGEPANFDQMDAATAALIVELHLQDSKDELEGSRGKEKAAEENISDNQIAMQLFQEDSERQATLLDDRKMAASISQAVRADAELLEA
jgi:hypothetical protein